MNRKSCAAIRASLSAYLDGALSGREMQEVVCHIEGFDDGSGGWAVGCEACIRELAAWRLTEDAILMVGPAKAPADLALQLRVAISHEQARRSARLLDRFWPAWDNAVRPMLVQISAGFAGTVVLVGSIVLLLSMVAAPQEVLANDEPLGAVRAALSLLHRGSRRHCHAAERWNRGGGVGGQHRPRLRLHHRGRSAGRERPHPGCQPASGQRVSARQRLRSAHPRARNHYLLRHLRARLDPQST